VSIITEHIFHEPSDITCHVTLLARLSGGD
jgi:hypothetical protein